MRVLFFENLYRDIRHALRGFQRSPGFTATVVLMLALGIGANTAIFSIVDRLLLRELPYPDGGRLMMVFESFQENVRNPVSPANLFDWQRMSRSFESLAAWNSAQATLTGDGDPELLSGQAVSQEFFPTLRVTPLVGRIFQTEDDVPNAPRVVVLSHGLWQRRFAGDPNVIGKKIIFDSMSYEVIGVTPADAYFYNPNSEFWIPYGLNRTRNWRENSGRFLPGVIGRLKPTVTLASAQAEMTTIASQLAQSHVFNKNSSVNVIPLREILTGEVRGSLVFLFAAVSLLLIIACFNVASMLLARSSMRRREIAVRTSLGAGQFAILRQLLVESLMLALAGGGFGFLIALWGVSGLVELTPRNLIRIPDVPLDRWVLMYTFSVSVLTGFLFGLVPAITATRGSLSGYLHGLGRSMTQSARLRQSLVVAQVMMTVVLLCGAGMLVRSFAALNSVRTGVDADNVLTMAVTLPTVKYNRAQQIQFVQRAVESLASLPGVQSAGAARSLPVVGLLSGTGFHVQGVPDVSMNDRPMTRVRIATPGYFKTLGTPLLLGRDFTWDDQKANAPMVFIINQAFAAKYFPSQDPLAISMQVIMGSDNPFGRIIGVIGDVNEGGLRNEAEPTVFYNHAQLTVSGMTLFVRSSQLTSIAQSSVQVIHELDRSLAVSQVRPLREAFSLSIARERLNAIVSAAFALAALLLASLGLYGLLSFFVAERTREIGIRMALGAEASNVLQMIMRHGLRLVALGGVAGLAGAVVVSRFIQSLLFGIPAYDPATLAGVAGLLIAVGALAAFVPARRATRVDPIIALRQD